MKAKPSCSLRSAGSSRNVPVVLARKIASYCFRFCSLMSAESYVMVVAQAPVFVPSASTVFAAMGIDECTNPCDGDWLSIA
jgi:hypothetical protein